MAIICTRVVFAIPDQNMDKLACRFRTGGLKHRVEVAKVCWQGGRHKKREQTSVVRACSKNLQGADHPGISRVLGSRSGETDRHAPQAFRLCGETCIRPGVARGPYGQHYDRSNKCGPGRRPVQSCPRHQAEADRKRRDTHKLGKYQQKTYYQIMSHVVSFLICNKHECKSLFDRTPRCDPCRSDIVCEKVGIAQSPHCQGSNGQGHCSKGCSSGATNQEVQGRRERFTGRGGATLDAALELVSAFHINDIGLHEQWLGWSNVPAFQKSGAVNAGFEKEMKTLRSNVLLTSV